MLRIKCFVLSVVSIIVLLISSCSNAGTGTNTNILTAESTDIPTAIPENTPTSMLLPTETKPAPAPLPSIKTQCVGNSNDTQKLDLNGVVAFEQKGKQLDFKTGFYLLDLKNRSTTRTIEEGIFEQVSPDRKHLVYRYSSPDRMHYLSVLDSSGRTISDFPLRIDGRGQSFFNWQNAEQLRTIQQEQDSKVFVQLLNPFTQEHTTLRTDWSGVYTPENPFYDKLVQWKFDEKITEIAFVYGANILYDPTLTRVVYPKDDGIVTLVDVETETELANAKFTDWGRLPSWSPDGEYLTIVNREGNVDEFYLIARDGNSFQRITDFSKDLENMSIFEYVWSPDSKQIAFWLNTEASEQKDGAQSELAVLDISSRQVIRLCIQGISKYAYEPWTMNHPEPVWSPDGKYIMITQWDDPVSPSKYYVLVIDPMTGAVNRISENTAPIGWMVSEP